MGFSTVTFIFYFFPVTVLLYYICLAGEKSRALGKIFKSLQLRNLVLIGLSLGFYSWAVFHDVFKLCIYIVLVYVAGVITAQVKKNQRPEQRKSMAGFVFGLFAALLLLCLFYFKYANFTIEIFNSITGKDIQRRSIMAPLGISFITFSAISYISDIWKGKAPSGNLLECALYISFFPKVISGPIVLWRDFTPEIGRMPKGKDVINGINRIAIGFGKKVIIADLFAAYVLDIQTKFAAGIDSKSIWLAAFLYMMQIYCDFSAYSDIALGISSILGFNFKENFNFPYRSLSITEFWRRWHISLGSWFREYVYIPLGGSRKGLGFTLFNLGVVFLLTGIWHGASWNYILWGIANGACVLFERIVKDKNWYKKVPKFIKWFVAMFITMFCWQLFSFTDLGLLKRWFMTMFGLIQAEHINVTVPFFIDKMLITGIVISVIGATVLGEEKIKTKWDKFVSTSAGYFVQEVGILILMFLSLVVMMSSTYSPFIYFQY